MATRVIMPKLGLTMTKGKVVKWMAAEGAPVTKGQPLVQITTEKIANVIEAPAGGVLRAVLVPEGATVAVLAPLAVIADTGEDIQELVAELAKASKAATVAAAGAPAGRGFVPVSPSVPPAPAAGLVSPAAISPGVSTPSAARVSPMAAKLAAQEGVDLAAVAGSGPGGRILREDVEKVMAARRVAAPVAPPVLLAPAAPGAALARPAYPPRTGPAYPPLTGPAVAGRASPAARRVAAERGVDLRLVRGTGPGSRILSEDVERAVPQLPGPASGPVGEVRRTIAQRMMESLQGTAQLTLTRSVNVTELARLREALQSRMERERGFKLTYTDLVVRATILALGEHPELNVAFDGESATYHEPINLGVAVDLGEGGLIVPVLRDAGRLGLADTAAAIRELGEKARQGTLSIDDVTGGTFTVTNLGPLGVDAFTPILNPPESAILGVGRVADRPVAAGGQLLAGKEMVLSLTVDHRIIDGAAGARFLASLARYLEEPSSLLSLEGAR